MAEHEAKKPADVQEFLSKHKVAVVDCYATWCGPCVRIAPYVHQKTHNEGVALVKVNVDECPELSSAYKIQAMPTFLVIKEKWDHVIFTKTGGSEGVVNAAVEQAKKHK